jgi:dipeptidyl aminopeptidase/acylaminoacyl peptidase
MYKWSLFLLSFLCADLLLAQESKLLTPEVLWKVSRVNLEDATSNGKYVMYSVTQPDMAANQMRVTYWLQNLNSVEKRALPEGIDQPRFSADNDQIYYLKEGILYSMGLNGKDVKALTDQAADGFLASDKGIYLLTHNQVMYQEPPSVTFPDLPKTTGRVYDDLFYRHWKTWDTGKRNNYFVAKKGSEGMYGAPENIVNQAFNAPTKPFGDISEACFSPDEKMVVYTSRKLKGKKEARSTNTDLYLYSIADKATFCITEGLGGYDREPAFSPDGKHLLWVNMATPGYEADRLRLMVLDTKTNERKELTENWTYEVNNPIWSADGKTIYFISAQDFTYQIFAIDPVTAKIRQITTGQHDFDKIIDTDKGIIATKHSMTQPNEVFLVDPKNGKMTQVTVETNIFWAPIKKAKVERETVRTTDGKDMNIWMVLPPDFNATKKYPALLYCQGGPQSATSQFFSYRWNPQLMASMGYVVIIPCRRGMPGSGHEWNQAISKDYGGQAMQDLLSASDAMSKKPYINADKMGAVGASFGGYSVYWLAGNHEKRFKTFISHCGMFNLESFYGTTEELFFAEYDLGKPYWEDPNSEVWLKDSPHKYIKNWDTPILVIHNELDFRVPFSEGMQAFQAAQLLGIPSKFLSFPDEGHHIAKPQNSLLWQRTFFNWLDTYLKN